MAEGEKEEGKPAEKKPSRLENVVKETFNLIGKGANLALTVGPPLAAINYYPQITRDMVTGVPTFIAGQAVSDKRAKKKITLASVRDESISATAQMGIIHFGYKYMNIAQRGIEAAVATTQYAPYADIASYVSRAFMNTALYLPFAVGAYFIADYLVKKKTVRGFGQYWKENYKGTLKGIFKIFTIPLALIQFVPVLYQVPVVLGLTFLYKLIMSKPKKNKASPNSEKNPNNYNALSQQNSAYAPQAAYKKAA